MPDLKLHPGEHETYVPWKGALPPRAWHESNAAKKSLNGTWKFRFSPTATEAGGEEFASKDFDDGKWGSISVPSQWAFEGFGKPWYTNIQFPFPLDPPRVPDDNPTGDYRLSFDLGKWPSGKTILRFDGVESWFKLWVNGHENGFATGSRLASEFDVTRALKPGRNTVAVRVRQWSAGSYLEDQDQWWLPGIFRDVTLLHRPRGCLEDFFVHAGYEKGKGTLKVESSTPGHVKIPDLEIELPTGKEITLKVEPWTAESPKLYRGELVTEGENIPLEIGFRTVQVRGDQILVNDTPITFYGINRHEFSPKHGRALDFETMEQDIKIFKQHNVNAVRTSHYPPHPYFLTLCDRYGLWVILECDFETHGFSINDWKLNPSSEEYWQPALLNRIERTIERDKNHPSIIIWSLGNEADCGENTGHMAKFVSDRDPSRPIHYEGDNHCKYVDIWSQMYTSHKDVEDIGNYREWELDDKEEDKKRRGMPFIMCEFAHAMGNGPGGVKEYIDLFDKYKRLHGGFVWEYIDHGIPQKTSDGREHYAYGGDFGEEVHDGNFITDGLMFPNRKPSPGMLEYRKMIQPVVHVKGNTFRNRYAFSTLDHLKFEWVVEDDGKEVARSDFDVGHVGPGEEFSIKPPSVKTQGEGFLLIRASLKHNSWWAKAGHIVAWTQLPLPHKRNLFHSPALPISHNGNYVLGEALFNSQGQLLQLGKFPVQLELDIWRAPTDNDRHSSEGRWRDKGLHRMHTRVDSVTFNGHSLVVDARYAPAVRSLALRTKFIWSITHAGLLLKVNVEPEGDWDTLPRLGVQLRLPKSDTVEWFGLGPGESYPDSTGAVRVSRWKSSIDDMQTPYVFPQENGLRRAVRWAEISGAKGSLRIEGVVPGQEREWVVVDDEGEEVGDVEGGRETQMENVDVVDEGSTPYEREETFGLTVRRWTNHDLDRARHTTDLVASDYTYVNVDVGTHGLGTEACGPGVLPQYELKAKKVEFAILLNPAAKQESCVVQ